MNAAWPAVAVIALIGLLVGSFLNAVVDHHPRDASPQPDDRHCRSCQTPIKRRHLVPVLSWLALRGRCASCPARISSRYPLVEAGVAVLFAAITLRFGMSAELPAYLYLAAASVAIALIDAGFRELPDSIVLPSYVVGVLLLMPAGAAHADMWPAERAVLAMALFCSFCFTLAIVFPVAVRFSDAKLAGLLGLYLGWLSWGSVLVAAIGGSLIVAVRGTTLRTGGRATAGETAVIPSVVTAAVLSLFVAVPLASCYTTLVHLA